MSAAPHEEQVADAAMPIAVEAVAAAPRPSLALLGDPSAAACDGDSCAVPLP
ncbi:hypothetical protein KNO15_02045 [Leifsonia shinshuensis]|uniref:hypothetical protein n=1 Tax=Leifsonia shinshuensis TaxID=150026 RepID=UPI001F50787F|nr:hypothetical protein [Leifsonia shinshuensis]MCI0155474.1 hypothetical protein [Leifsonia shinshuensis]